MKINTPVAADWAWGDKFMLGGLSIGIVIQRLEWWWDDKAWNYVCRHVLFFPPISTLGQNFSFKKSDVGDIEDRVKFKFKQAESVESDDINTSTTQTNNRLITTLHHKLARFNHLITASEMNRYPDSLQERFEDILEDIEFSEELFDFITEIVDQGVGEGENKKPDTSPPNDGYYSPNKRSDNCLILILKLLTYILYCIFFLYKSRRHFIIWAIRSWRIFSIECRRCYRHAAGLWLLSRAKKDRTWTPSANFKAKER